MPQRCLDVSRCYGSAGDQTHLCKWEVVLWMKAPMWSASGCLVEIILGHVKSKVGLGWGSRGCKKGNDLVAENQVRMFALVWIRPKSCIWVENWRMIGTRVVWWVSAGPVSRQWFRSCVILCLLFPFTSSSLCSLSWMGRHTSTGPWFPIFISQEFHCP